MAHRHRSDYTPGRAAAPETVPATGLFQPDKRSARTCTAPCGTGSRLQAVAATEQAHGLRCLWYQARASCAT
ncbi:hypothetical protein XEUVF42_22230, partial [Xanthomonas euvesicatoria]